MVLFLLGLIRWLPGIAPDARFPVQPETVRLARSWAMTGELADPYFAGRTGPSAHSPPVYPVFMGTLLKIYGDGREALFSLAFSAAVLLALQAAMLPLAAVALGIRFEAGVLASLAWLLAKIRPFPEFEANLAGVLIMALTMLLIRWVRPDSGMVQAMLAGGLSAVLALTATPAVPVVVLWFLTPLAAPLWRGRRREILGFWLCFAALLSPWVIRNYKVFGEFIPLRVNFGLELAVSNNGCANVSLVENLISRCFESEHPNASLAEAKRVAALGEPAYHLEKRRQAFAWIAANPAGFASLTARRFVRFWIPSETGNPVAEAFHPLVTRERLWIYLTTLMSIFGLLRLWRTSVAGATMCTLWLAVFPLIYYIVQFVERYRRPVLWITFLLAGAEMWRLIAANRVRQRQQARPPSSAHGQPGHQF